MGHMQVGGGGNVIENWRDGVAHCELKGGKCDTLLLDIGQRDG